MENWIDPEMPEIQKRWAGHILSEFGLKGIRARFDSAKKTFFFTYDRRVVPVPESLIKENRWSDIRHLFRAVLNRSPAIWNHGCQNDWGGEGLVDSNSRR